MNDKLKQIEASIALVERINEGLGNTHETLLAEALTLLKEVEEGKKFVGEWSKADNHSFAPGDLMFGLDEKGEPVASLKLTNNGIHTIPQPKED